LARSSVQFKSGQQEGHQLVTPSQVTLPLVVGQLLSVAEQLLGLMSL
jgi:hypothetical protein